MSDNWQVGDLAVCVRGGHWTGPVYGAFPCEGETYVVLDFHLYGDDLYLELSGAPENIEPCGINWGPQWHSGRFRKILPDKHEQCEPEFVTLLKRIKPKVPA